MIDRVRVPAAPKTAHRSWPALKILIPVAGLLALVGLANAQYFVNATTLEATIATQVRLTTGLVLKTDDTVRFSLLPQPHVAMANLQLVDPSGTLTIDADHMVGEIRLLPLIVGRLELAAATLDHPRLDINLDGRPMPPDSTIGRALRANGTFQGGNQRLGIVTLNDGTALIRGKGLADTAVKDINVTVDWRNLDAPATLTGTVNFHDAPTDVAAWVGQPSNLLRGDHSAIAIRLQSAPLDLSANGDLESALGFRFHGRLSVSAPSLGAALTLAGYTTALPAPFANVVLTSDATIGAGVLNLPSLRLRADGNDYEGTLAYRAVAGTSSLSGTLATEHLAVTPFMTAAPPLVDKGGHWSEQKLPLAPAYNLDLDLRISASHLHVPPVTIDDAALAIMTRDNRTEVALLEGRTYGGSVKGRASIGFSAAGLSLRTSGSVTDADASGLSWDVFGRQLAAGTLSGSANLEGAGDTPAALIANMHGWAKAQAVDGDLSNIDLSRGLREMARKRLDAILPALRNGRTPFQSFTLSLKLEGGIASVEEGSLKSPDADVTLDGNAVLRSRSLDLRALAVGRADDATTAAPQIRFDIGGTFGQAVVTPNFGVP